MISAAFAAAAQSGASGEELLAAIVAGYEAMARVGMAANAPEGMDAGFHPTAIVGGFGRRRPRSSTGSTQTLC